MNRNALLSKRRIFSGILSYANVYGAFQQIQNANSDLLAAGDQKTGVIGEFYGLLYAKSKYLLYDVQYATHE